MYVRVCARACVYVCMYVCMYLHNGEPVSPVCVLQYVEYLNQNADMFQRTATRLRRKLWWQNVKLWIILIVIILAILAVIISKSSPLHACDMNLAGFRLEWVWP